MLLQRLDQPRRLRRRRRHADVAQLARRLACFIISGISCIDVAHVVDLLQVQLRGAQPLQRALVGRTPAHAIRIRPLDAGRRTIDATGSRARARCDALLRRLVRHVPGVELRGQKGPVAQAEFRQRAADHTLALAVGRCRVDDGAAEFEEPLDQRLQRRVVRVTVPDGAEADHGQALAGGGDGLHDHRRQRGRGLRAPMRAEGDGAQHRRLQQGSSRQVRLVIVVHDRTPGDWHQRYRAGMTSGSSRTIDQHSHIKLVKHWVHAPALLCRRQSDRAGVATGKHCLLGVTPSPQFDLLQRKVPGKGRGPFRATFRKAVPQQVIASMGRLPRSICSPRVT